MVRVRFIGTVAKKSKTSHFGHSHGSGSPHGDHHEVLSDKACQEIESKTGLHEQTVRKCYTAFKLLDADSSGLLDTKEIKHLLAQLDNESSDEEIEMLLRRIDSDESGSLDFEEFVWLFSATAKQKGPSLDKQIEGVSKKLRTEMQLLRKSAAEMATEEGCPQSKICDFLRKEIHEAEACLSLPWGFALFLIYFICIAIHEKKDWQHHMDKAIKWDILENANFAFSGIVPFENGRMGFKAVPDVNNIPDWWSWLSLGLVPLLWPETWDVSEPRANVLAMCAKPGVSLVGAGWPASAANLSVDSIFSGDDCAEQDPDPLPKEYYGSQSHNLYLFYNRLLGGLRLRIESSKGEDCAGPDKDDAPCYRGKYWLEPELVEGLTTNLDEVGSAPVILSTGVSRESILRQIRQLEKDQWLTPAAHKMEVSFLVYNANLDAVTMTYVNFYIAHSGQIWKKVDPSTLWLTPYPHWLNFVPDLIWLSMTLKIFVVEGLDILSYVRQLGLVKGLKCYGGFWNAVDWISVFVGFAMVFLWVQHVSQMANVRDFLKTADRTVPGDWPEKRTFVEFMEMVDAIIVDETRRRRVFALYPFIVVLRLVKGFSAQARLAVMTRTLSFATSDIIHFGVIFICVFLVFAISAMELFGQELYQFARLDRSMNTCWRVLNGDIDWDDMIDIGRLEAGLWFWLFTWLVQLVILNMLVALIMDTYQGVRASMGESETLWSQSAEIWRRKQAIRRGWELPLETILLTLDDTPLDEGDEEQEEVLLTVRGLMNKVPKLNEEQAHEIITNTISLLEQDDHDDVSLSQALQKTQKMRERQLETQTSLEQLFYLCQCMSDHLGPLCQATQDESPSAMQSQEPVLPTKPMSLEDPVVSITEVVTELHCNGQDLLVPEIAEDLLLPATAEDIAKRILTSSVGKAVDDGVYWPILKLVQRYADVAKRSEDLEMMMERRFLNVDKKLNELLSVLQEERRKREEKTRLARRPLNGASQAKNGIGTMGRWSMLGCIGERPSSDLSKSENHVLERERASIVRERASIVNTKGLASELYIAKAPT